MAILLNWRVVRRTNAATGQKVYTEGSDSFATRAALQAFIDDKIQNAPADIYKIDLMIIPGGA